MDPNSIGRILFRCVYIAPGSFDRPARRMLSAHVASDLLLLASPSTVVQRHLSYLHGPSSPQIEVRRRPAVIGCLSQSLSGPSATTTLNHRTLKELNLAEQ